MLSVLPEGEPPFTSDANASLIPESVQRFQRWSNETRGTALLVDGIAGRHTRRALVEAYMALDHTTLPESAKVLAHGCGSNQPPSSGAQREPTENADLRRVDIFAFEGNVRPPPPGSTSGPDAPEYPAWVAQMVSTIDVEAEDSATYNVVVTDEHDRPIPAVRITLTGPGFEQDALTDASGAAFIAGAPPAGLTGRLSDGLAHCLSPLLTMPPRDRDYPIGNEGVLVTPSTQRQGFPVLAEATTVVMVLARTDISFDLPRGWEELEVDADGPWRLSKDGGRACLKLVSDGTERTVTLRCPLPKRRPASVAFPQSPLWTTERRRILQRHETLDKIARRYLGDEAATDALVSLNPELVATAAIAGEKATALASLALPEECIPRWLSIPDDVIARSDTGDDAFEVFATIEVDMFHDALFLGKNHEIWRTLADFPREPRNGGAPLSDEDYLEIYNQCMNAEIRSVAANDD